MDPYVIGRASAVEWWARNDDERDPGRDRDAFPPPFPFPKIGPYDLNVDSWPLWATVVISAPPGDRAFCRRFRAMNATQASTNSTTDTIPTIMPMGGLDVSFSRPAI